MAGEKQPSLELAAAVAETAKKIKGAYVFSSLNKSIVREENASAIIVKQKFAQFACADCGTEIAALDAIEPKCITCGSHKMKKGEEKAISIKDDTELVSITCGACNSLNVMHKEVASTLKGMQHCATCGTELMNLTVEAQDELPMEDEVSVDDLDVLDTDGDGVVEMEASPDEEPKHTNPDEVQEGADDEEKDEEEGKDENDDKKEEESADEEEEKEEEESGPEDNFGGKKAPPFEKKETSDDEEKEEKEEESAPAVDGDPVQEGDTHCSDSTYEGDPSVDPEGKSDAVQEGDDDVPMEMEAEDVDMVDMVDEDNIDEMALVAMGSTILLSAGKYNVASLSEEKAGDNKDVFYTKEFQTAIIASLKSDGLRKTMAKFKFEPIKVKAKVKKHVAKKVKAGVEKAAADLKQKSESMTKDWRQALDIAATGLNKSFWKNAQNPLKAALVRELTNMGVRNPEKLVSSIFEKHGLEYAAVLIETAKGLLSKSRDMRNELAEVLNMTGVLAAEDNDEGDDEDDAETSEPAVAISEEKASRLKDERRRGTETAGSGGLIRELGDLF